MNPRHDPILQAVSAGIFFFVNVLALYLLLRGHNAPGGGFIAGLASSMSLVLLMLAFGVQRTHRVLRLEPVRLAAFGLLLALISAFAPVCFGRPFLEQFNTYVALPLLGEVAIGTPLVFDTGVFLLVIGVTTRLVFTLAQSTRGARALNRAEVLRFASPVESPIEEDAPEGLDEPNDEPLP